MKINELVEGKVYLGNDGVEYKRVFGDLFARNSFDERWRLSENSIFFLLKMDFEEIVDKNLITKDNAPEAGTKVLVKDKHAEEWNEATFVAYSLGGVWVLTEKDVAIKLDEGKLIEEDKEGKEDITYPSREDILDAIYSYCWTRDCKDCKHKKECKTVTWEEETLKERYKLIMEG